MPPIYSAIQTHIGVHGPTRTRTPVIPTTSPLTGPPDRTCRVTITGSDRHSCWSHTGDRVPSNPALGDPCGPSGLREKRSKPPPADRICHSLPNRPRRPEGRPKSTSQNVASGCTIPSGNCHSNPIDPSKRTQIRTVVSRSCTQPLSPRLFPRAAPSGRAG